MAVNFGSMSRSRDGREWIIRCEPHVRTRLRRLFARVSKSSGDEVVLSNTPENCRDLEWFTQRYPLASDHTESLARSAQEHLDVEIRLDSLL
jgi:hypothetical protein